MITRARILCVVATCWYVCGVAPAIRAATITPVVVDFSTDENGVPLINGQAVATPPNFGRLFAISSSGATHSGPAIFDSSPTGPNAGGRDPDLLVDLGNILILQHLKLKKQQSPGIFAEPNDTALGGTLAFDFLVPNIQLASLDLIDMDENGPADLRLTDSAGKARTYFVPKHWTKDRFDDGPMGYATLDLMRIDPQPGENGVVATAIEDAGFNARDVRRLEIIYTGSAAMDNLRLIPEPSTVLPMAAGLIFLCARWRKGHGAVAGSQR